MRRLDSLCVPVPSPTASKCCRAAATLLLFGLLAPMLPAGETWDGGGANDNWTTGANWNANPPPFPAQVPPPNNGTANIHFAGNQGTIPNIDVPYSINSLTFDSGAVSFFVVGQELTIGAGGIINNDNSNQFVSAPVRLAAEQTWSAAAGLLAVNVINLNGHALTLNGGFPVTLTDSISGAGSIQVGSTVLTLTMSGNASNTYTGSTIVIGGTLVLQKTGGTTAIPGPLTLSTGATARLLANEQISNASTSPVQVANFGTLDLNGFSETVSYLSASFNGSVTTGGGTLTVLDYFSVANDSTFSGNLTLGDVEASVTTSGQVTTPSELTIGDAATGTLLISGAGHLSSSNSYIGREAGSTGAVSVIGAGSTWTNSGFLGIGENGYGDLEVLAGGSVTNTHATVGQSGTATALVFGAGSTWTNSSFLEVGNNGIGELTIENGGLVANTEGYVGRLTGSDGTVIVRGTDATWTNTRDLQIGVLGNGSLQVETGGKVIVQRAVTIGSLGQATIHQGILNVTEDLIMNGGSLTAEAAAIVQVASSLLRTGATATVQDNARISHTGNSTLVSDATFEVKSGATAQLNQLAIGTTPGPEARFIIDGAGTTVTSPMFINVGLGGTGAMTVSGGAHVTTSSGTVGGFAPGTVGTLTLDGADASGSPSTWTILVLYVGFHETSQGSISILNGGRLEVTGFNVGAPGTGSVSVTGVSMMGAPSLLDAGNVNLAQNSGAIGEIVVAGGGRMESGNISAALIGGTATLTVSDANSTVEQSGAAYIKLGQATGGSATLNVRNNACLTTGTAGIDVYATGEVNLESGAVLDARGPINMNGGQFNFLGGTLRVDTFNGNLLNQGGTFAPGHSVGTTAVSGNYTQHAVASFEIEVADVFPGDWDVLTVEGNASLDGAIEVLLLDDFEPVLGNSFTIITTNVGNVGGQFDTELLPVFNGLTFDVVYNPKSVVLQVIEATTLPGDHNQDGTVDAADYVMWRKSNGSPAGYTAWVTHFGESIGTGGSNNTTVPEPPSFMSTLIALITLFIKPRPVVAVRC